ncbi:MAG: hypothetical protein CMJ83_13740 [Planctomycetes bacterium]|nr:hypothetical protein [Planctomycetota bacterium]
MLGRNWLLAGAVLLAMAASVEGQDFQSERAAAAQDLVKGLERHAKWCQSKGLLAERDRIYRRLIELNPKHQRARRVLCYRKQRDGSWRQVRYRKPANRKTTSWSEMRTREQGVVAPYCDRVVAMLARHESEVPSRVSRTMLEWCVALHPDHPGVQRALGHVNVDGRWLTPEQAAVISRRRKLAAWARECRAGAKVTELTPSKDESESGVPWAATVQTTHVRLLATVSRPEAERAARAIDGVREFVKRIFGSAVSLPSGYRIYLLDRPEHVVRLGRAVSSLGPDVVKSAKTLAGVWASRQSCLVLREETPGRRLDAIVRQSFSWIILGTFNLDPDAQGALCEGLGLYLTKSYVGTAVTWFGAHGKDGEVSRLKARLISVGADWRVVGAARFAGTKVPALEEVLTKTREEMRVDDVLVAGLLVRYLVETRPNDVTRFLSSVAAKQPLKKVIQETLRIEPESLRREFQGWIRAAGQK